MEETKEKETKEKLKLSTIRIGVISETCLLIIWHKKKVMQVDPLIYYFYYILFCSQNVSSGIGLLVCCICTRNLHERDEKIAPEYVRVRACVRAYVCRGCYNINARIKIDTREWVVGSRLWCYKIVCFEWQHDKNNKVVVRPAKTQISLGIRLV